MVKGKSVVDERESGGCGDCGDCGSNLWVTKQQRQGLL